MANHKPFRELLSPNSNFEFVGNAKIWVTISLLSLVLTIGLLFVNKAWRGDYLNWSIDFKGGTEIVIGFHDAKTKATTEVDPANVRSALTAEGYDGFTVADFYWNVTDEATGKPVQVHGMKVATLAFGAVSEAERENLIGKLNQRFADREILNANWSGDRLFVRSKKPFDWAAAKAFFAQDQLELKEWPDSERDRFTTPQEGTGEYNAQFSIRGIDVQVEQALERHLDGVDVQVVQTYAVGSQAGERLKGDGLKSLFYAIVLIMVYLIIRFDVRYAPGAVVALLHDAWLVVGAFAITWEEVSLTSVAALLTVMGYSVNDTVIIFDRIRENVPKMRDKKLPRIINISINETLARSLLTSSTVFAVTLMMNIFGTGLVRNFAFTMNVGVVVGTYSSIFIASPVMLWIHNHFFAKGERAGAALGRAGRPSSRDEVAAAADEPDAASFAADDDEAGGDEPDSSGQPPKARRTKRPRKR